jgi:hypothetical protein
MKIVSGPNLYFQFSCLLHEYGLRKFELPLLSSIYLCTACNHHAAFFENFHRLTEQIISVIFCACKRYVLLPQLLKCFPAKEKMIRNQSI